MEEVSVVNEFTDSEDEYSDASQDSENDPLSRTKKGNNGLHYYDELQEKNTRIHELEREMAAKDDEIKEMKKKFNENAVKHKEGIYWLQLELDSARRDQDATEEQMAEMMNDLQNMIVVSNSEEASVKHANSERAIASMENQISMIKTSAGEVVKTLKEEISDLMEDRAAMEVNLLNQLAHVDIERSNREKELELQIRVRDETIERLSSNKNHLDKNDEKLYSGGNPHNGTNTQLTEDLEQAYREVQRLELANADLKADLDRAEEKLDLAKSKKVPEISNEAIVSISKEREEVMESLNIVSSLWNRASNTITSLEDLMERLANNSTEATIGGNALVLPSLQAISLLHGQVKVSLLMNEMKLRNQLESLAGERAYVDISELNNDAFAKQLKSIQDDSLETLRTVEEACEEQIRLIEERVIGDMQMMKSDALNREEAIKAIQEHQKELEMLAETHKSSPSAITVSLASSSREGEGKSTSNDSNATIFGVKKEIILQLQTEVLRTVERMKEKNHLIELMRTELQKSKETEDRLKKELKRVLRRNPVPTTPVKQSMGKKNQIVSGALPKATKAVIGESIQKILPRSPRKTKSTSNMPMTSPRRSSDPMISPLAPSPREVDKGRRHSLTRPDLAALTQAVTAHDLLNSDRESS